MIGGVVLLGGCSLIATNSSASKEPLILSPLSKAERATRGADARVSPVEERMGGERATGFFETPKPPMHAKQTAGSPPPPPPAVEAKDDVISAVALENMPLPQFINAIYAVILKRSVSVDPAVLQRTDLVSLRTGKPQSAAQLAAAAQAVLRSYGLAATEFQGLVRVVPETNQSGYLPEIWRGRAQPEIPASLRPVFYYVELEHTLAQGVVGWLRSLFAGRLSVTEDSARNSLMLSGQSDTVAAAMEAIQLLDQPLLRGRVSVRINPVFWSADEMSKRLVEVLTAEGYAVANNPAANTPIVILPIGGINSVIVFAVNERILNHTLRWARDIDQAPQGNNSGYVNYYVRNTDATDLAKTLQEVMTGIAAAPAQTGVSPPQTGGKKVVVNAATNGLIIKTTPAEFQQLYGLLQELDRPARSVLIQATVAEVRLTDSEQFGFNWLLNQFIKSGVRVTGGVGLPGQPATGTFRLNFANFANVPQAMLTALASSNRIRILSNPSIVALNGQSATIQVGQEVPILTSQISNANTGTATGQGIMQTIQYRNTGVILRVKPVIHSGGRVDLEISQEVSAAQKNETGVDSSPIILTRRVESKMSLTDGNTTLLGGLISENRSSGDAGLPYLKDIPLAGALFKTNANSNVERTELVVLLTPHVISDDFDAQAVTSAFRSQFAWAVPALAKPDKGASAAGAEEAAQSTQEALDSKDAAPIASTQAGGTGAKPVSGPRAESSAAVRQPSEAASDRTRVTPRAKPYALPDNDGPELTMSRSVAPIQQPVRPLAPFGAQPVPPSPERKDNTPAEVRAPKAPDVKPVLDETLKKELLEAVMGGK